MRLESAGIFRHIEKENVLAGTLPFQACHASTLAVLPDGSLFCAWFAGSREGADDVAIWGARRAGGAWQKPKMLQPGGTPHWNPVLFVRGDGAVLLFFKVGRKIASWQTQVCVSRDGCRTWSPARELVPGDRGGRGPVRNKPIVLSGGRWLAPASLEDGPWRCFTDRSDDGGKTWQKSNEIFIPLSGMGAGSADCRKIPVSEQSFSGRGAIQPTLWESEPGRVHMLMRTTEELIFRSDSEDGGETWCPGYATGLPSNNSGIDLDRSEDGCLFLAYNPVGRNWGPRFPLCLACSEDNGITWKDIDTLEAEEGEYSYPSVNCCGNSLFVTYTSNRTNIAFWKFDR